MEKPSTFADIVRDGLNTSLTEDTRRDTVQEVYPKGGQNAGKIFTELDILIDCWKRGLEMTETFLQTRHYW